MNRIQFYIVLFGLILISIFPLYAQDIQEKQQVTSEEVQKLREDLQKLIDQQVVKLEELEKLISEIQAKLEGQEQEDELQALLAAMEQLGAQEKEVEEGVGKRFFSGLRQMQILNPNISLLGEFYGGVSSSRNDLIINPDGNLYANSGFFIRGLEVNIDSPLDPFTRGKSTISFSGDEIEVELGFLEWINLPLRSNIRAGKIRPEFGSFNRYHAHALPQFDRPRALANLFGLESMAGLGFASSFLLPPLFASVNLLEISVIKGGSGFSFTDQGKYGLIYTADLKNFYDISPDTYFEWTISGAVGKNDPDERFNSYIGDLGLTYKWAPSDRLRYRTVEWRTEFILSKRESATGDINTFGFYSSLQNRLSRRYVVSSRVGYSELPFNSDYHEWDFTTTLDYWQSEFVFVRLQYSYFDRNIFVDNEKMPNNSSFLIHVVWAMGPHKHESY